MKVAENNFDAILNLMTTWAHIPLFERRDGKLDNLLEIDGKCEKRKAEIKEGGEKIMKLLEVKSR